MKHLKRAYQAVNKTPLWKKIVAVFLIVAMPLFFLSYRTTQIQQIESHNISQQAVNPSAMPNKK